MIGERQITSRFVTTKRLDRPWDWRWRVTLAKSRCEVELPMSMPTVLSSTLSWLQMNFAISALSGSVSWACSCSKSTSCIRSIHLHAQSSPPA